MTPRMTEVTKLGSDWCVINPAGDAELGNWVLAKCTFESTAVKISQALNCLTSPEPAPDELDTLKMLASSAKQVIDNRFSNITIRGKEVGVEASDGEKCWVVHSDDMVALDFAVQAIGNVDAFFSRLRRTPTTPTPAETQPTTDLGQSRTQTPLVDREAWARARCKACHHPGNSQCRGPDCWCWENELRGIDAILSLFHPAADKGDA